MQFCLDKLLQSPASLTDLLAGFQFIGSNWNAAYLSNNSYSRRINHMLCIPLSCRVVSDAQLVGLVQTMRHVVDHNVFFQRHCERAKDTVQRLEDYLRIINRNFTLGIEERKTMEHVFFWRSMAGVLYENFKYQINYILCYCLNLELPERSQNVLDKDFFLGSVRMTRILQKRFSHLRSSLSPSTKRVNELYTLFQGVKKGLLPLETPEIMVSLQKHAKALTQVVELGEDEEDYKNCVERVIDEVFPPEETLKCEIADNDPFSRHACFEASYANKGFTFELARRLGFLDDDYFINQSLSFPDLIGCLYDGPYVKHFLYQKGMGLSEAYRELVESGSLNRFAQPKAFVSIVLEPMKARIISKGSFDSYAFLRPIQQAVWKRLKSVRQFRLIGEPLMPEHFAGMLSDWEPGKKFVSADFSAATDNLSGVLSRHAAHLLFARLGDPFLQFVAEKAIGDTSVFYYTEDPATGKMKRCMPENVFNPDCYSEDLWGEKLKSSIEMTNGQLMGSPLSFPLLCLINAAVLLLSFERRYGRKFRLKDLNFLVNGDDLAFTCDPKHYSLWWSLVKKAGLIPSVGKNFFSDRLVQINSELYMVDTSILEVFDCDGLIKDMIPAVCGIRKVGYANFGLILNRKKNDLSGDTNRGNNVQRPYMISEIESDFLENLYCDEDCGFYQKSIELFWKYNSKAVVKTQLDPYLPKREGGLELKTFRGEFSGIYPLSHFRSNSRSIVDIMCRSLESDVPALCSGHDSANLSRFLCIYNIKKDETELAKELNRLHRRAKRIKNIPDAAERRTLEYERSEVTVPIMSCLMTH